MTKTLFFDAFNGVAGDMILGALVDLGVPLGHIESQLRSLDLEGYSLEAVPVKRKDVLGVNFRVRLAPELAEASEHSHGQGDAHHHHHHHDHDHSPGHSHSHGHSHSPSHGHDHVHEGQGHGQGHGHSHHGSFAAIRELIEASSLAPRVKSRAVSIFRKLAEAEAKAHGMPVDDVHFHEVGAIDSIVDIVGACIGFEYLEVEEFGTSPINLGSGTVTFSHGTWPVPAPATAELLKGFPVERSTVPAELTTPTGAAVLAALVDPAKPLKRFRMLGAGLGAGDKELTQIPNMLRLVLGESLEADSLTVGSVSPSGFGTERVVVLEANIDDMDAEMFGHFMSVALDRGALDVFFVPIQMKKNRPGQLLNLLCRPEDRDRFAELIFAETTTIGLRHRELDRFVLERESIVVESELGPVRCKVSRSGGRVIDVSPEHDDLSRLSEESGMPLREIRRKIMGQISKLDIWERSSI